MTKKSIGAGAFKQACLAILDEVAEAKTEIVITKRGRPVARLLPIATDKEREEEILASLRGKGRTTVSEAEFLKPAAGTRDWAALRGDD